MKEEAHPFRSGRRSLCAILRRLKVYNMKIMAEYVIKEIDFEDLENISVGWDESAYDDVDIMLVKSFIMNELEREYGEGTHIEVYSLGDLIEKMENLVGEPVSPEDLPFDQVARLMDRFFGKAVKFFVDEEGNLFVALLVDMLPTSSDFMTTLWRFWSNDDK